MADCAPLLDEELSSFVFNYLTENSGSQYGEEEVCSDRLDTDFPDIDLSQLDTSDFDSVNCLSELQWCNDQPADASPASIHYSTADELFEIEEENAALLAALTDSLDGMVDAEGGGLSVFPALEDEDEEPERQGGAGLRLGPQDLSPAPGPDAEDLPLLMTLLLTPPNVPSGSDAHKDGVHGHSRYSNRSLQLRPLRPVVKTDLPQERRPRAVRPAGRLCTELHRHLTTAQHSAAASSGEAAPPDTDDDEDDDDEDSESEEDEEEEEGAESSSSEAEAPAAPPSSSAPPAPQWSSEKELASVVELITYMHTYCLPTRKQQQQHAWERREAAAPRPRARPDAPTRPTNSASRVVLVSAPVGVVGGAPRRLPFARRREMKANSLLRDLLQQSGSFDVSKPYRLHSPPYAHNPLRGHAPSAAKPTSPTPASSAPKPQLLRKDSFAESRNPSPAVPRAEEALDGGGSFSVRRSRRLASFPSRFAKRLRPARPPEEREGERAEGGATAKLLPTQAGGGTTTGARTQALTAATETTNPCCPHEKRACLRLPLNPKPTGESQFSTKTFEPTLSVDLCGTAGLTPPTTPPHKSVEDEVFKPTDGGKGGGGGGLSVGSSSDDGGGESVHPPSNVAAKSSPWPSRAHHHPRKLPEQTELYAQLQRMGQAGDDAHRHFGDHDYCAPSVGESRKRSAAILDTILQAHGTGDAPKPEPASGELEKARGAELPAEEAEPKELLANVIISSAPPPDCRDVSRSSSPILPSPDSPASKTDSSENSEICPDDKQRNKAKSDEDNCQVFYIHNLPSSVTQNMLRKRFQVFGKPEDCKVIVCNEERCGVIKIRQAGVQRHWRDRDTVFQNGPASPRRQTRKRYIDLDEAGPGPVKSKYDALDFDTLLKEAQKSLHR